MITCQICGKEFKAINKRHLAHHNITREEYVLNFPDSPLQSAESQATRKAATALRNATMSDEAKSDAGRRAAATRLERGFTSWNDGKGGYTLNWSDEARQRVKERGPWNKGIETSDEICAKISKTKKERFASGETIHWNTGKTTSDETKQKISESCSGYKFTPKQSARHLAGILQYRNSPNYKPSMLGKHHTDETKLKLSNNRRVGGKSYNTLRKNMENSGKWIPIRDLPEFKLYKRLVSRVTEANVHLIPNYDVAKRGRCSLTVETYQVDHIYSLTDGFLNNVDPAIIGHVNNLRFIPWRENNKKWYKSDITLEELLVLTA